MARVPQERSTQIAATVDFVSSPARAISTSEDQALEVMSLSVKNRFSDVSFSADSGQIVGIAGIQGSGHADIFRATCGRRAVAVGQC